MLYVVLRTDIRSKGGRLYAKRGKVLRVLFKNSSHYICEVGKYSVPVFENQVEEEIKKADNEKQEYVEAAEDEGPEGFSPAAEDIGGKDADSE